MEPENIVLYNKHIIIDQKVLINQRRQKLNYAAEHKLSTVLI